MKGSTWWTALHVTEVAGYASALERPSAFCCVTLAQRQQATLQDGRRSRSAQ